MKDTAPSGGLFRNLMGLETEYVIKFHDKGSQGNRPTDARLFRRLASAFKKALPVAKSASGDNAYFAANGGKLVFESSVRLNGKGLVEGATPECYSPRDVLIAQRAQDQLLSQAAESAAFPKSEFRLLKNNRDKNGNTYGCHENYDATFATGIRLKIWQATVISLYPLILLGWAGFILMTVCLVILSSLLGYILYRNALRKFPDEKKRRLWKKYQWDFDKPGIWSRWNFGWGCVVFSLTLLPSVVIATAVARLVAFHPIRKTLVSFLVTRPSWAGAGWVDSKNNFFIQQRPAKCVVGEAIVWHRPIIHIANLIENLIANPFDLAQFKSLLRGRQRLQIAFSDSNMCEEAEYLKVATTRLLIDAIEAGALKKSPRIWRPLAIARTVGRGLLKKPIARFEKQRLDAIEVQQFFCRELSRYVQENNLQTAETDEIFARWNSVLRGLELDRPSLVGRVDWITKRFLLDELDASDSVAARRKVDLKYHELSPQGYYFRLVEAGVIQHLVTGEEIEQATRLAPGRTRAAVRGRYIREFSGSQKDLKINWDSLILGAGKTKQIIEFPPKE